MPVKSKRILRCPYCKTDNIKQTICKVTLNKQKNIMNTTKLQIICKNCGLILYAPKNEYGLFTKIWQVEASYIENLDILKSNNYKFNAVYDCTRNQHIIYEIYEDDAGAISNGYTYDEITNNIY